MSGEESGSREVTELRLQDLFELDRLGQEFDSQWQAEQADGELQLCTPAEFRSLIATATGGEPPRKPAPEEQLPRD